MLLNLKNFNLIRVVFVVNKVSHNWVMSNRSLTVLAKIKDAKLYFKSHTIYPYRVY
jgi:hypothetical protein